MGRLYQRYAQTPSGISPSVSALPATYGAFASWSSTIFQALDVFSRALDTTFGSRLSAGVRTRFQNSGTIAGPHVVSCQSIQRFAFALPSGVEGSSLPFPYFSTK